MPTASEDRPRDGRGQYTRDPATAERDAEICRMRRDGMTLRQIGAHFDMHHSSVIDAINRALRDIVEEPARDLITREDERLDHYLAVLAPKITDGDDRAVNTAVRISESRRKLHGLDAPRSIHVDLERRLDLEGQAVADAIAAALDTLNLTPEQHAAALEAAQQRLLDTSQGEP